MIGTRPFDVRRIVTRSPQTGRCFSVSLDGEGGGTTPRPWVGADEDPPGRGLAGEVG
jgi:hypothetical protein